MAAPGPGARGRSRRRRSDAARGGEPLHEFGDGEHFAGEHGRRGDADAAVAVFRVAVFARVRRAENDHEDERQEGDHADDASEAGTSQAGPQGAYHSVILGAQVRKRNGEFATRGEFGAAMGCSPERGLVARVTRRSWSAELRALADR